MGQLTKENTWIVIPAYNEAPYLQKVLAKSVLQLPNIVVVDDGSQDRTSQIAQASGVVTLTHRLNLGKGAALKTGCEFAFKRAGADAVILMDGDDQHDAREIPLFLTALNQGNQVVFGIREENKNMPWIKLKLSRLSSFLTYLLFGKYILDIPSGYKAFTKQAYQKVSWNATDYAVELEIVARTIKSRLTYATVNIKTIYHDTSKGLTPMDALSILRYLLKLRITL